MTNRFIVAVLLTATASLLTGCERQSGSADVSASVSEAADMGENAAFSRCLRDRIPRPWNVVDATLGDAGFVVRLAALSADLEIQHRANDSRQQQFVDLTIGPFTTYNVLDPGLLQTHLASGALRPAQSARGIPAASLAPLDVYEFGDAQVLLLINPNEGEFCIDHGVPDDWPNPFARCQLVVQSHSAVFTFSSAAIAAAPQLFAHARSLLTHAVTCFEQEKDRNHG